jgi:hypothetical protein
MGDPNALRGKIAHQVNHLLDKTYIVISLGTLTHDSFGVTLRRLRWAKPIIVFPAILVTNRYVGLYRQIATVAG